MPRRSTMPVDLNPLDVVVPPDRGQEVTRREVTKRSTLSKGPKDEQQSAKAPARKVRVAFYLSEDLADEIRNGVVHLSGPPLRLNMTVFAEMAFQKELGRLKAKHNGGKPFPKRQEDLKGGRPIR
jgi:hypothetical protein